MEDVDELILLENDGVQGKYFCPRNNTIIEAVGTVTVPRDNKVTKYKGTVIWSYDISVTLQVKAVKKICGKYCNMSDKEILKMAREKINWTFGEFYGIDAANIIKLAKKYNLNIEMVDIDSGEKLIL